MTEGTDSEATFLRHEPCPSCHSRDNLGRYSDGHGFCFSCEYYEKGETNGAAVSSRVSNPAGGPGGGRAAGRGDRVLHRPANLLTGEYHPLAGRNINEETCRKWGYRYSEMGGRRCQVADYYSIDGSTVVAQKVRFPNKEFMILGDIKLAGLFGQQLWRDQGRMVVVTEGEIDALSVGQLQSNKWPVVSVPNGSAGAKKSVAKSLEWLLGFEHVVLMFDNDEPGRKASIECARLFPPGRCKIASLPLKDANDMLVAHRGEELINAMWGAKTYRPDGLVTLEEVRTEVLREPESGLPWCFESLTKLTYGRRLGECYGLGAGTGVGKTDFIVQQVMYDLIELKEKVGVIFLEQQPTETVKRIAGKVACKRFHVPSDVAGWRQEDLSAALDRLSQSGALHLYDHFGTADWPIIQSRIRYLAKSEGVRLFYLDHLTALAASLDDERRGLDKIMAELGGLVKELNIIITFVSHLATPEGKPHEEGGRVMLKHLRGSRAIVQWAHYVFGLERDQQAGPDKDNSTTFRVLKDRYTGDATGKVFHITYDSPTGMLREVGDVSFESAQEADF